MHSIYVNEAHISWNGNFIVNLQGISLTLIILETPWRKKMQFLSLKHASKYYKSFIPTMEITCDYGFTKIKWEAAVPNF